MSDASREAPSPPAAEPAPTTSPGGDDEQPPAAEDQPNNPAAHPPFEPLFTLLTNTSTNTTIHPRVHYLFSDDDPSMLTSAVAAATSTTTSTDNPRDRALIVDLAPSPDASGWSVSWASSLSPDFAVTSAQLQTQQEQQQQPDDPTHKQDQQRQQQQQQQQGMLRLEGVEREPADTRRTPADSTASGEEDVEALMEDFRRRMGVLGRVVGEGERRGLALRRQQEEQEVREGEASSPAVEMTAETRTDGG